MFLVYHFTVYFLIYWTVQGPFPHSVEKYSTIWPETLIEENNLFSNFRVFFGFILRRVFKKVKSFLYFLYIIYLPCIGISTGLFILVIWATLHKSGLNPPWQQNILSSIIAATGIVLNRSVNVLNSFKLYRLLPKRKYYIAKSSFLKDKFLLAKKFLKVLQLRLWSNSIRYVKRKVVKAKKA